MIGALRRFREKVSEACQEMSSAGKECIESLYDDFSAPGINAQIQASVINILNTLEAVPPVIQGLRQEIEWLCGSDHTAAGQ